MTTCNRRCKVNKYQGLIQSMSRSKLLPCLIDIRKNTSKSSRAIGNKQQELRAGEIIDKRLFKISIQAIVCLMYTQHMTNASKFIIYHAKKMFKMSILAIKSSKVVKEDNKLITRWFMQINHSRQLNLLRSTLRLPSGNDSTAQPQPLN